MFVDVDLDEPTPIISADGPGRNGHVEPAPSTPATASRRPTIRGKPSYHFSIKRPRRNVAKRSIATLPYLKSVQEEEEEITRADRNVRERYRVPMLAFALFLLVCSAGGYRSINEVWISRKVASPTVTMTTNAGEDVAYYFRGFGNGEQRGSLILTEQVIIGDELMGNITTTSIEDVPTLLFGETIVAPEELANLVDVFHETFNPHTNKLFLWHIPRSGSTTITRIASYCLGLTVATETGRSEAKSGNNALRIIEDLDGIRFANVDMSYPLGIQQAKMLNVGQSNDIDFIASPYLWDSAGVFDGVHKG